MKLKGIRFKAHRGVAIACAMIAWNTIADIQGSAVYCYDPLKMVVLFVPFARESSLSQRF